MRFTTEIVVENVFKNPGFVSSKPGFNRVWVKPGFLKPGFRVWQKAGNPGTRVSGYPGLHSLIQSRMWVGVSYVTSLTQQN